GVLDVGHDQAAFGGCRDPQVHVVLDHDLLVLLVPGGVDLRVSTYRHEQGLGHQEQWGDLHLGEVGAFTQACHGVHGLGDVHLQELGDVRCGERAVDHGGGGVFAYPLDRGAVFTGRTVHGLDRVCHGLFGHGRG